MASPGQVSPFTPLQRFWRLLKADRKDIGYVYVYAVLIGLMSLAVPLGVQAIINLIAGGTFNASLVVLAVVVAGATAFVGVLRVMQKIIAEALQRRLFTRAALEFAYRLPRIRLEALRDTYPPELVNRFFDTVNVQKGLPKILLDFTGAAMQVAFGIMLVTFYDPLFGIFGFALVALTILLIRVLWKPSLNSSLEESMYKYAVAGWLEDVARASTTFKLAGGAQLGLGRTDELVSSYLSARERHFGYLMWHYTGTIALQSFISLTFLLLGGYLVIENRINIGQFVAAELVILATVANIEKIISSMETVYDVLTGLVKLSAVTDLPLEVGGTMPFSSVDTGSGIRVDVSSLTFKYPRSGSVAVNNLNLHLDSNDRFCLAGFNRSGRSTLLQLLSGLRLDFSGRLLYNGTPINNFALDTLRQSIGDYTPGEAIFPGTVTDNICLGHPGVSFDDIQWALETAGLQDWLAEQSAGYDTMLIADGLDLPRSVGTRLLLARAIVRRPRLLIIGGQIEQLEPRLRMEFVRRLVDPVNKWTLVIASNDPRVASLCQRVGVMQGGNFLAVGKPSEVMQQPSTSAVWSSPTPNS